MRDVIITNSIETTKFIENNNNKIKHEDWNIIQAHIISRLNEFIATKHQNNIQYMGQLASLSHGRWKGLSMLHLWCRE